MRRQRELWTRSQRHSRRNLRTRRIRVNAINPGLVITEDAQWAGIVDSDFEKSAVAATPLGRAGKPDDIARRVSFLASDDARWITGETIPFPAAPRFDINRLMVRTEDNSPRMLIGPVAFRFKTALNGGLWRLPIIILDGRCL